MTIASPVVRQGPMCLAVDAIARHSSVIMPDVAGRILASHVRHNSSSVDRLRFAALANSAAEDSARHRPDSGAYVTMRRAFCDNQGIPKKHLDFLAARIMYRTI
jgi:hypothetical protein